MWTAPNLVTLLRIALLPVFLWRVWQNDFRWALVIFFLAGVSDWVDGWLARRFQQQSELGQRLDPIADKLLLVSTFLILTLPGRGYEPIPLWLTATVILRDVLIVLSAAAVQLVTGFSRFRPSFYGKLSTTVQMLMVGVYIIFQSLGWQQHWLLRACYAVTALMTVFSGLHYIVHVRLLLAEYRKERA